MNKLEELVFQALGEASMCWDETPKGVFESSKAKEIGEKLLRSIRTYYGKETFEQDLEFLINSYSKEAGSDTPDFILAQYMDRCLENFNHAVARREGWYGRESKIYSTIAPPVCDGETK